MDPMNTIVAKNIKRLREENKLSMEELSKLSGVSKSMLAQIGMKVPFDALTVRPERAYEIVRTSEVQPLLEDSGKVKNYSIFPDDENRRFAVYYLELDEDSYWESDPHLKGTTEFITVFEGRIAIYVEGQTFSVEKGESIRFQADNPHSYRNTGTEKAVLHMILYNP